MGVNGYGVHGAVRLEQMAAAPAFYSNYRAAGGMRPAPLHVSGKPPGYPMAYSQRNHHHVHQPNPTHQPRQFHHYPTPAPCDHSLSQPGTATGGSFKPGMKDVPQWLKSLRLHKYTALFETLGYAEMMALDEVQLQRRDVTTGARRKILQSIQRLRDRPRALLELDARLRGEMSVDAVRDAIDELRAVLGTPIGASAGQRAAPCLSACILRLLARVYGVLFKPAMDGQASWCRQPAGGLLPEIEDEHVVRLAQVCDRILGHEAFEAGEKQQVAGYRNALRRYIQNNGIRPTPVASDYKPASRNVTKPLSHSNSFLYDATTVGDTVTKFANYRRANSENCGTSTAAAPVADAIPALALLSDSQRAHLRNWMLLLRDYHVSRTLAQEAAPQYAPPLVAGPVGQPKVPGTWDRQPADEHGQPANPSPTESRCSASENPPAAGQLLDNVIEKFDVWRPMNEANDEPTSARPMPTRPPADVPTVVPLAAPKSPSDSGAAQPDYACAFSCSSGSDRSSGAGSPMVYDFFGDEPPLLELTFDKPRRYCSGYGSADDGSGVEDPFGALLSRQDHYKLFY